MQQVRCSFVQSRLHALYVQSVRLMSKDVNSFPADMINFETVPASFPQKCFQRCAMEFGQEVGTVFGLSKGVNCFCQGEYTTRDFLMDESSPGCTSPCSGYTEIACGGGVDLMSVFSVERVDERRYERQGCRLGPPYHKVALTHPRMTPEVGIYIKVCGMVSLFCRDLSDTT